MLSIRTIVLDVSSQPIANTFWPHQYAELLLKRFWYEFICIYKSVIMAAFTTTHPLDLKLRDFKTKTKVLTKT